ncbi:hypothetical protein AB1484_27735 [Parafrankia sp. FMc6]|uniref:hypothetical protein n=1 Tax=Parafrankia soli TaxID=2599596 RepID=UPI0034D62B0C
MTVRTPDGPSGSSSRGGSTTSPSQVAPQASPRRRPCNAMSSHSGPHRSAAARSRNAPTSCAPHGSTSGWEYSGSSTPSQGLKGIIRWRFASFSAFRSVA